MSHAELISRIKWLREMFPREYAEATYRIGEIDMNDDSWLLAMDTLIDDIIGGG